VTAIEIVGLVLLGLVILAVIVGEALDTAWGIGELFGDLIDWLRERRDRRRSRRSDQSN
jgi:hypothetical protein